MKRLISAEIYKLRKRGMTLILLLILIGITIIGVSIMQADGHSDSATADNAVLLSEVIPMTMTILSTFGSVLAVILVASAFGNEYSWHTMRGFLLCSESRFIMLIAKLIAVGIMILVWMVIAVITALVIGTIFTVARGFSFNLSFITVSFVWEQFLNFLRTFYVMLPYILLSFLCTIVGRSVIPGIGFGTGILLLEPFIIALLRGSFGWVSKIPDYLLYTNVDAISLQVKSPIHIQIGPNVQIPGTGQAFLILAVYSIVFVVIAFYLFKKRDVTG